MGFGCSNTFTKIMKLLPGLGGICFALSLVVFQMPGKYSNGWGPFDRIRHGKGSGFGKCHCRQTHPPSWAPSIITSPPSPLCSAHLIPSWVLFPPPSWPLHNLPWGRGHPAPIATQTWPFATSVGYQAVLSSGATFMTITKRVMLAE